MKLFFKSVLFLFAVLLFSNNVFAQHNSRYYVTVNQNHGKHVIGRLVAINDSSIVVAGKEYRNEVKEEIILLKNITKIKAYKQSSGALFTVLTGAAVAGNAVFAFTQFSGLTALGVASGGTLGIVALSVIIYKLAHPPMAKLSSSDGINYEKVNETFKVYIQRDQPKQK